MGCVTDLDFEMRVLGPERRMAGGVCGVLDSGVDEPEAADELMSGDDGNGDVEGLYPYDVNLLYIVS